MKRSKAPTDPPMSPPTAPTPPPAAVPTVPSPRRPRPWLAWGLVAAAILPPTLLLYGIMSCFGLGSDAAALRESVVTSANPPIHRQAELKLGWVPLTLARLGLRLADLEPEARLALESVRGVEVGLYGCGDADASRGATDILAAGDDAMRPRGWERVVGVIQEETVVGVYTRDNARDPDDLRFCVVVRHGDHLVLAAVQCRAGPLMEIVREHLGDLSFSGLQLGASTGKPAATPGGKRAEG